MGQHVTLRCLYFPAAAHADQRLFACSAIRVHHMTLHCFLPAAAHADQGASLLFSIPIDICVGLQHVTSHWLHIPAAAHADQGARVLLRVAGQWGAGHTAQE
jgi:hypothetical protein